MAQDTIQEIELHHVFPIFIDTNLRTKLEIIEILKRSIVGQNELVLMKSNF